MPDIFFTQRKLFGEILREYDLVSQEQLDNALKIQKTSTKRLGEILVSINAMTLTQVAETLAVQLELQFIQLDRYQANAEAIKLIPKNTAERLKLIPLQIDDDGTLLITMADPLDLYAQDEIKLLTGHNIRIATSGRDDITRNLHRIYDLSTTLGDAMNGMEAIGDAYTTLSR